MPDMKFMQLGSKKYDYLSSPVPIENENIDAFPLHGTVRFGTARYGTAQFGSVCVSTAV